MTARDKFTVNQRVIASDRHPDVRNGKPKRHGTVRGFGVMDDRVRVLADGRRSTETWSMDYWEPLT